MPAPPVRRVAVPVTIHATAALVAVVALAGARPAAAAPPEPAPPDGAALFRAACSSCHGADGAGLPRAVVGFDVAVPDFTECTFTTREADADWTAVVTEGGPARGFAREMPAFGDALAPAEIRAVVGHVRTFCPDRAWPRGELNLPRPLFTEKAYVEDEAVLSTAVATSGAGSVASKLVYEQRFGARNQLEVIVPFAWLEGDDERWRGGIGDLAFGAKRVLVHSLRTGTIASLAAEIILPTGNVDRGLGKGHTIFEPFAAVGQILPWGFFLHLQGGAELPVDPDKGAVEVFWRGTLGATLHHGFGRAFYPMVEVLGARELEDEARTQWDLVPQVQMTVSRRHHLRVCAGARVPLTDRGSRHVEVVAYLLWDWFDGGLLEGW
jgi:mono/diheme cytochrome c family protein